MRLHGLATAASSSMSGSSICRRPAVSTMRTSRPGPAPGRGRGARPRPGPSWLGRGRQGSGSACRAAPAGRPPRAAAGRQHECRRTPSCLRRSNASFAAAVVLPDPEAGQQDHGRRPAREGELRPPEPISSVSSSWTILTTSCPGLRLLVTAAPVARSRTRATNSLTTLRLTSPRAARAGSRASRGRDPPRSGRRGREGRRARPEASSERVEHEPAGSVAAGFGQPTAESRLPGGWQPCRRDPCVERP